MHNYSNYKLVLHSRALQLLNIFLSICVLNCDFRKLITMLSNNKIRFSNEVVHVEINVTVIIILLFEENIQYI